MSQLINFQLLEVRSVTAAMIEPELSGWLDLTICNQQGTKIEITLFAGGDQDTLRLLRELNRAIQDANLAVTF